MDIILPVYLNQNNVFDLIAMLNGGIATVTSVSESESGSQTVGTEVKAGFGLGQALGSLLKVNLDSRLSAEGANSSGKTTSEERVHTPASLLFQLRKDLKQRKMLTLLEQSKSQPGSMVEFECVLSKNPAVSALDNFLEILDVATMFGNKPVAKGAGNKPDPNKGLKQQISAVRDAMKSGDTIDLIGVLTDQNMRAVITLDKNFLSDQSMSNLVEGKFKVLGKVIRSVETADEPISLVRKSALSSTPQVLNELTKALNGLSNSEHFSFPEIETTVNGPAVHVIPVGIYV